MEVAGQRVLDLGAGLGGYSVALQQHGARVVSVDRSWPQSFTGIDHISADALCVPIESVSFDIVICASLIEHVALPSMLVGELHRLLRDDGIAYLSFPPFYTPIGGHQFSPFHLLGERVALTMHRWKHLYRGRSWLQEHYPEAPASFARAFGEWGLYPLTISKVERILRAYPFQILERSTRWLPIDVSGLPVLGEFLTWHVQYLLCKAREL